VLLSGGLDSATALAIAKDQGFSCHALSFDYGQRHRIELEMAHRQAVLQQAERHLVLPIDLRQFGGSALTDDLEVPKNAHDPASIPITYVPARNTVFLSLALAWAESLDARDIFIGVNALDYSGYPDCRPEFIAAFEAAANLGTKAGVEGDRFHIRTPLIDLSKAEIIREGIRLGVDYGATSSCYDPKPREGPCGACDSCLLRARGFAEAGFEDPLVAR
jgi:7-cyano-7-deazaguanine synthase